MPEQQRRHLIKQTGMSDTFERSWPFILIQNVDHRRLPYIIDGCAFVLRPGEVLSLWLTHESHVRVDWGRQNVDIAIAICSTQAQSDDMFARMAP